MKAFGFGLICERQYWDSVQFHVCVLCLNALLFVNHSSCVGHWHDRVSAQSPQRHALPRDGRLLHLGAIATGQAPTGLDAGHSHQPQLVRPLWITFPELDG